MEFDEILTPGLELEIAKAKVKIDPPNIKYKGRLLAFDQSLSSTGWALLTSEPNGKRAYIWGTGVLKSGHDLRGHQKTLDRFVELRQDLEYLFDEFGVFNDVVIETPPVGSAMIRPESSLLAAAAIMSVSKAKVHMVSRQKASKRWTGKPNSPKKEVRDAIMSFGYTPKEWGLPWNEHISDSLSLALLFMEQYNG